MLYDFYTVNNFVDGLGRLGVLTVGLSWGLSWVLNGVISFLVSKERAFHPSIHPSIHPWHPNGFIRIPSINPWNLVDWAPWTGRARNGWLDERDLAPGEAGASAQRPESSCGAVGGPGDQVMPRHSIFTVHICTYSYSIPGNIPLFNHPKVGKYASPIEVGGGFWRLDTYLDNFPSMSELKLAHYTGCHNGCSVKTQKWWTRNPWCPP